jgi:hypothetical protein
VIVFLALDAIVSLSLEFVDGWSFRGCIRSWIRIRGLRAAGSLVRANNTHFSGMNVLYSLMPNYMWFAPLKVCGEKLMCNTLSSFRYHLGSGFRV